MAGRRKKASWMDVCRRVWLRIGGKVVRFLEVERYEGLNVRHAYYLYRLPETDRRPRGLNYNKLLPSCKEIFAQVQEGVWTEVVYA